MKLVIQLFLCVLLCAIVWTCSFRSIFFRFSPQRQGSRAPTTGVKTAQFKQLWEKTVTGNARFPTVLFTSNRIVDETQQLEPLRRRRRNWSEGEIATMRELVTEHDAKVPPTKRAAMWNEIGVRLNRSSSVCRGAYSLFIKVRPSSREKTVYEKWTKSETAVLQEQVELHKEINPLMMRRGWQEIGRSLNRTAAACEVRYNKVRRETTGIHDRLRYNHKAADMEFTPEQDALIRQRVEDWGDKGWNRALFTNISEELGGVPAAAVRKRFYELRSQHENPVVRFHNARVSIRHVWNATLDARLSEAVRELGDTNRWQEVAERMNCSVTWSACRRRWGEHVKMIANYPNTTLPWTEQEFVWLGQLVSERAGAVNDTSTKAITSPWKKIGDKLGRLPAQCASKWRDSHFTKKGRYTPGEDALILQRVEEWGDKGVGLWRALEAELGRLTVRQRCLALMSRQRKQLVWTEKMDDALEAALHGVPARRDRWTVVAERMQEQGWRVTAAQCGGRYRLLQVGPKPVWTPQMIEKLMSLRKKGASWPKIGEELKVSRYWCNKQWTRERDKLLKHGPFTAEDDARIRKAVDGRSLKELSYGFWSSLQEDMGRPGGKLRRRWTQTLLHRDA